MRRSSLFGVVLIAIVISMLLRADSASCVSLLDSDFKEGSRTKVFLDLTNTSDAYDASRDSYQLDVNVANLDRNDYSIGPVLLNVHVYLPSYAEDVAPASQPKTIFSFITPTMEAFSPRVDRLNDFCVVSWNVSGVQDLIFRRWIIRDYTNYFLDFSVPKNQSVSVYMFVQMVFYSDSYFLFSKVADEKLYWLHVEWPPVESSNGISTAPSVTPESESPTLLLAPIVIWVVVVSITTIGAFFFYKIRKRRAKATHQTNDVDPSGANRLSKGTPVGVFLIAIVSFIIASLALLMGIGGPEWIPSLAAAGIISGILLIIDGVGLLLIKTWAWYLAVVLSLSSLVNNYVLFPNPSTIVIPLEIPMLVYLFFRRNVFEV